VREYGAIRDALIDTAVAAGMQPTLEDLQLVFDCTITGIAHAVSEYTFQRDAELRRQATNISRLSRTSSAIHWLRSMAFSS